MMIDGIGFNVAWANEHTEKEFIDEFSGSEHVFPGKDKEAKLKEAYRLLTGKRTTANLVTIEEPAPPAPDAGFMARAGE